ncbi:hypothetical protein [Sphingomonas daechungensis]|uniref:hypothetical protein n=1 Tax=Sphingomonas daechungensis TaxID=1176646 RepID=UPI003783D896
MPDRIETALVEGEPVPESAFDRALLGSPSLVTLKHDTEGDAMKVRIIRACGDWLEGDEPEVNADYGKQLIDNGLAEEVRDQKARSKRG